MPTPVDRGDRVRIVSARLSAPAERFEVVHGYKDRESVQLRIEQDGVIYAAYTTGEGRNIKDARDIPFDDFLPLFKTFVDSLAATAKGGE